MSFSNLQTALLGVTSFAIFYTVLGIPFGRLADKSSRSKLIAVGLALWSLFFAVLVFLLREPVRTVQAVSDSFFLG